jgi:hypothetical protein
MLHVRAPWHQPDRGIVRGSCECDLSLLVPHNA